MNEKLLIIDDNLFFSNWLKNNLISQNFSVENVVNIDQAKEILNRDKFSLIILNLSKNNINRHIINFIKDLRKSEETCRISVCIITDAEKEAKLIDKLSGLEIDGFFINTMSIDILILKIKKILRII